MVVKMKTMLWPYGNKLVCILSKIRKYDRCKLSTNPEVRTPLSVEKLYRIVPALKIPVSYSFGYPKKKRGFRAF